MEFEDSEIASSARLPGAGGLRSTRACSNRVRYGFAWGGAGSAQTTFDEALTYAGERVIFGKPVATFQLRPGRLTWMGSEITRAQSLAFCLSRLRDEGKAMPAPFPLGKRSNIWVARECAPLSNREAVCTYEGMHDIRTLILGEAVIGHSAFS